MLNRYIVDLLCWQKFVENVLKLLSIEINVVLHVGLARLGVHRAVRNELVSPVVQFAVNTERIKAWV